MPVSLEQWRAGVGSNNAARSYALKRRLQGKNQTLLSQFLALVALFTHWVELLTDKGKLTDT